MNFFRRPLDWIHTLVAVGLFSDRNQRNGFPASNSYMNNNVKKIQKGLCGDGIGEIIRI